MALFGLNVFDQLTDGQWNESSSCGFNQKCKDAKLTISTVCAPLRAQYGENVYQSCVTMAQAAPRPQSPADVLCINPLTAWENYGFTCEGYQPPPAEMAAGAVEIGGKEINLFYVAAAAIFVVILFIAYQKFVK